jgi:hypothetical protein
MPIHINICAGRISDLWSSNYSNQYAKSVVNNLLSLESLLKAFKSPKTNKWLESH